MHYSKDSESALGITRATERMGWVPRASRVCRARTGPPHENTLGLSFRGRFSGPGPVAAVVKTAFV